MANWGGLNNALNSFRNGLMRRFPNKDTRTDGARADAAHGSTSEHQEDPDGTVDAYDCDINWLRSADPDGNSVEDRISEAVKADFMADPRSRLWIHNRQIANKNVDNGRVRTYTGRSPHTEHIHFECIQRLEDDGSEWKFPRTDALLRELNGEDVALSDADITKIADKVWAKMLDVDVSAEGENMQGAGSILRYGSSEHHRIERKVDDAKTALGNLAKAVEDLRRIVTEDKTETP